MNIMDKQKKVPSYTINAIRKYQEAHKDEIKEKRKIYLEKKKYDDEYVKKRNEYQRLYKQRKRLEFLNKMEEKMIF